MQSIRTQYRVPARRGKRISFTCCDTCGLRLGTIVAATSTHLRVRWDDDGVAGRPVSIHPTWNVTYLEATA